MGPRTSRISIPSPAEAQLIRDCKAGKSEQLESLVGPYVQSLKLTAYSILHNPQDMEEVVQETILKALAHIHQLRDGESFKAWLLQIAVNEARMRLRKDRKHLFSSVEEEINKRPFQPKQFVDWRNVPSEELERKELRKALAAALGSLEEGSREVFVLRDVQHMSAADTGRILAISEGAVNTRLHRARMQMRELLNPLFKTHGGQSKGMMSVRMMRLMGRQLVGKTISCRHVIREISNYIDGQLPPELRRQVEEHLQLCHRCSVLVDTVRKLLFVVGDEQVFALPQECKVNWERITQRIINPAKAAAQSG